MRDVLWLAYRDYRHEWRMSGCLVLGLAAVLAPLLVLFGLKFGVISGMLERLVEDPRNREVRPVGSGRFGPAWFEALRGRSEVAFLIPRTRTIAATLDLRHPEIGRIVTVELIPSAPGDPLLPAGTAPQGLQDVVLSAAAARKLEAAAGDTLDGSVSRTFRGSRERARLPLRVTAVAGPAAFPREGAFVSLQLLAAVEEFRDGRAVPALDWRGDPPLPDTRAFPGFRLYARSLDQVAPLRDRLEAEGVAVRTNAADIELVRSMDRGFSLVFWLIALVGLTGYSLSLGASLWANVDRKQRELSALRLLGLSTRDLVWFPAIQALFTGGLGWLTAALLYLAVARSINVLFASRLAGGQALCRLLPLHFGAALGFTLAAAVLSAALAGYRAARIEPAQGLREM